MSNKKILSMILSVSLFALVLSACGGGPNRDGNASPSAGSSAPASAAASASGEAEADKPSELTVWADVDEAKLATLESITKKYSEATGIAVKLTPIAMNDQPQALSLDGPAGKGPDLFYQPGIGELVVKGLVQPMNVSDDIRAEYTPESLEALSQDGQLYGLPAVVESLALLYNKELTPEPPKTIAELEKLMAERTDKSKDEYGFLYNATDFYFSWAFMGGSGGYIFKENNGSFDIKDIGFNKEGSVKGLKLIQSWFEKGYLPKGVNGDIVGGLFNQGKVAAVINGPWAITDHRDQLGDKLAVAPLPQLEDGGYPTTFIGVKGWMLSAFSKNPEWATDLAAFITNAENSLQWFKETGETPPNLKTLNDPALTDDPLVSGFSEQIQHGMPFPNVPELSHVWEPMANALKFASEGQDVQAILDEAVKQIEERIEMAGAGA